MKGKYLSVVGILFLSFVSVVSIFAAGDLDTGFGAFLTNQANNNLYANHVQPDGKILVVGDFDTANDKVRPLIARFFSDGTLDTSFYSPLTIIPQGIIENIKTQSNGKILIGGRFYQNNSSVRTFGLLRLNADGSLDSTFNNTPGVSALREVLDFEITGSDKIVLSGSIGGGTITEILSAEGTVEASQPGGGRIEIQNDNKILVIRIDNGSQGMLRRFNADLSVDATFQVSSDSGYTDVAALPDGKFVVIGLFNSLQGFAISRIARFNSDGSLDTTFNSANSVAPTGGISEIKVQSDGKIVVAGQLTAIGGASANGVARINTNGTVDNTFNAPSGEISVVDLDIQPDGKILVGNASSVVRLNVNGSFDSSYTTPRTTKNTPFAKIIRVQSDDKILASYGFNTANEKTAIGLVRFNADGTIDNTFNAVPDSPFTPFGPALALQPDGKILVPASISTNVVRLNSNGSRDGTTFENSVGASLIAVAPDGKIYIGGSLSQIYLRRYFPNGLVDSSFIPAITGTYIDLAVQPDGKILVVNNNSQGRRLYRLNIDGSNDSTFALNGGANSTVYKIALQPDGKIIVGGSFTSFNQDPNRKYLVRVNADGSIDSTFNPTVNQDIYNLKLLNNGKITLQVSNISGAFDARYSNRLLRVNSDGTPDSTFNNNNYFVGGVTSLDVQSGNRIIAGGTFNVVSGIPKIGIARLLGDSSVSKPMFDFDGDGRAEVSVFRPENGVWYLNQSQAGFAGVQFGVSTDKLVPADYDGDGKTDLAVFRPSNGYWYLQRSSQGFTGTQFGQSGDIPVPADYDGDGRVDLAVFRPSNGYWYLLQSTAGFNGILFGVNGDRPVPADYDGDGRADLAVNRGGIWYLNRTQAGFAGIQFGEANDKLVPADYDGDGKTDLAVFRPSNGVWYLQQSTAGFTGIQFGLGTDTPVAADYDGDGKADLAVVRQGIWYLNRTQAGFTGIQFGTSTDLPLPNAFVR